MTVLTHNLINLITSQITMNHVVMCQKILVNRVGVSSLKIEIMVHAILRGFVNIAINKLIGNLSDCYMLKPKPKVATGDLVKGMGLVMPMHSSDVTSVQNRNPNSGVLES